MSVPGVAYRFGPFRLDPVSYRFFCEGSPVQLAPKALDLLLLLVAHPGALVSKDDIMQALWPQVAVTDNALTQVVSDLRQALGDSSSAPRFIQTVARRGYRFIAAVETAPAAEGSSLGDQPAASPAARGACRRARDLQRRRPSRLHGGAREAGDDGWCAGAGRDRRLRACRGARSPIRASVLGLAHARFWLFEVTRARNRPDATALAAAIADAHHAIDLDPDLAEAHAALALMLTSAGRTAEAVVAGRQSVALEPGNWRNHCRLGVPAWGDERLAAFARVLELYPDFAYAYYGMAMVHIARGDLPLAETLLRHGTPAQDRKERSADRFPAAGLHWLLGLIRLASGDAGGARANSIGRSLPPGTRSTRPNSS